MPSQFRIATYNIEWFTNLFTNDNQLDLSDEIVRYQTTKRQQAEAIAKVLTAVDADLLCIVEAPDTAASSGRSTIAALENFASHFNLRTRRALTGFISETQQEIALLYDPDRVQAVHRPQGQTLSSLLAGANAEELRKTLGRFMKGQLGSVTSFDSEFVVDVEEDGIREIYSFSRPPLEAQIDLMDGANIIASYKLLGVHTKSKGIFGPEDAIQTELEGLANRRKLLGECQWIRDRVDSWLDDKVDFIVLGDFNDGPGLDFWERQFGRSGVEIVMGDLGTPERILCNPFTRSKWTDHGWKPASASFYQRETGQSNNVLLDFVMLSPNLAARTLPTWRIWHPYDDMEIKANKSLQAMLLAASDHFPVSVDLTFADDLP